MKNRSLLAYAALIGGTLLVVLLLLVTRPQPGTELSEARPLKVLVVPAERTTLAPAERVTGRLQPVRSAQLAFEVGGRLAERLVEPGLRVEADEPLLVLDRGDLADLAAEAEAQYQMELAGVERDRDLLKLAQRNRRLQADEVARIESLGERSLASKSQLDAARQRLLQLQAEEAQLEYAVATAEARLQLRRAARDRAARNLARAALVAPFAGTVNTVAIDIGDTVRVDDPVLELVDTTELDLYVEVRSKVAANLGLGQPVAVNVDGRQVQGRVQALQKDPARDTNTHALRIRVPGEAVLSGVLASARLDLVPLENVVTVPATAVVNIEGQAFVFVFEGDRLKRAPVVLGRRVDGVVAVREGLDAGALVVARDVAVLADGQRVVAERLSAAEAAP